MLLLHGGNESSAPSVPLGTDENPTGTLESKLALTRFSDDIDCNMRVAIGIKYKRDVDVRNPPNPSMFSRLLRTFRMFQPNRAPSVTPSNSMIAWPGTLRLPKVSISAISNPYSSISYVIILATHRIQELGVVLIPNRLRTLFQWFCHLNCRLVTC